MGLATYVVRQFSSECFDHADSLLPSLKILFCFLKDPIPGTEEVE